MEFLGGYIGHDLPFSNDVSTAEIPLAPAASDGLVDWSLPLNADQEAAMARDLDAIIAETTSEFSQQGQVSTANDVSSVVAPPVEMETDLTLPSAIDQDEISNDLLSNEALPDDVMEMDFDSIFDIPED